jgi:hypothetical protein
MQTPKLRSLCVSTLLLFLLSTQDSALSTSFALAQSATATLSGTVQDQSGAVVSGASVIVVNVGTRLQRQTATNQDGYFTIPLLPPSTYTVTVRRDGFAPVEVKDLVLNIGDEKSLQIQLKVGSVSATVEVTGQASLLNESPAVGTVVERQFVANIPLNGRSLQSLIALTPGVVFQTVNSNPQGGGQFSVNGQRPDANYFTVDGVSANFSINAGNAQFTGQAAAGSLPGLTALGGTNSLVSIDALQEFKIQTSSYAPEFGRVPGGQISLITRSGTNSFHGDLFDYLRNDVMDAKDWFTNNRGLAKPEERQNDFGGVLGGPIIKDRTFFFFSYEGLRLRQPVTTITPVPTLAARQLVSGAVKPFFDAYPLPNGPLVAPNLAEFAASYSNPATLDAYNIRIDQSVKQNITLFGSYKHSPSSTQSRTGALSDIGSKVLANDSVTAGFTWVASATTTNDLRFNWGRVRATVSNIVDTFGGAVVPPDSAVFAAPRNRNNAFFTWFAFDASGASSSSVVIGTGNDNLEHQYNVVDTFSWVKGAHQLKFGIDYRRISPVLGRAGGNFANLGFNISAQPTLLFAQIGTGGTESIAVFNNLSAYAQDTWNVTPRLTLTYGLRWDVNPSPSSANGHDPAVLQGLGGTGPATLAPPGTPLYGTHYPNFGPRAGIVYHLGRSSGLETVVRGGFGIFYDTGAGILASEFDRVFPYFANKVYFGVPFPLNPTVAKPPVPGVDPPQQFYQASPNLRLPYTLQWNATVEQSVGQNQVLTISYVGSAGRRLLREQLSYSAVAGFGPTLVPSFLTTNESYSDYRALQVQLRRRLSRGIQGVVSYTWANSNDTSSADESTSSSAPSRFINIKREYGPSDFDVRHTVTGALTIDLPRVEGPRAVTTLTGGWGIDLLERYRTALPANLTTTVVFGPVPVSLRPNLVPGVPEVLHGPQYPGGKALNTAAFVAPPPGTFGNFPRNSLRFFSASQTDLSLRRQFGATERLKLQLRVEFFNVFNHPNFADPSGLVKQPPYNVSTRTLASGLGGLNPLYQVGGPRSGQVSLKFLF